MKMNYTTIMKFKKIGSGGYGLIYAGKQITNKEPVAIKYVKKYKIDSYNTSSNCIIPSELYSLVKLKNIKGVINLIDCYQSETKYIYVMERPPSSRDLFEIIGSSGAISEHRAKIIFN